MSTSETEPARLGEPTVLGAMRRHRVLVACLVVASVAVALAWGLLRPAEYRATATVSAPRPSSSALQTDQAYLDSQVALLGSGEVGDLAARIAGAERGDLGADDFAPGTGEVEVVPPVVDSSGSYGTSVITVAFTAGSAEAAAVGANAVARAYDDVRYREILDQSEARLRGIDRAISEAESEDDLPFLRAERAQALIEQGTDLAHRASIDAAERPRSPAGRGLATLIGVGLGLGILVGGAAAFVRASRLRQVGAPEAAERLYGAPVLSVRRPGDVTGSGQVEPGQPSPPAEVDRLLARAVIHRLDVTDGGDVVAVLEPPAQPAASPLVADLALALADADGPVLAVDGRDGSLSRALGPGGPPARARGSRAGVRSRHHQNLRVLDLSAGRWTARDGERLLGWDGVAVVDCPPLQDSRGVDLLSWCSGAVVLVGADDPVEEHEELVRWLRLTGTPALGTVFTPHVRRGLRRRRRARSTRPATVPGGVGDRSAWHPTAPGGSSPHRPPQPAADEAHRLPTRD